MPKLIKKIITLYDKQLYYQDIELKAGKIVLDYEKTRYMLDE
jgi:hypothetical protein